MITMKIRRYHKYTKMFVIEMENTLVVILSISLLFCVHKSEGNCYAPPPFVANSKFTTSGVEEGDHAVYSCQPGYQSQGPHDYVVKFCQFDTWQGLDIDCQYLKCPAPSTPAFGDIIYTGGIGKHYYMSTVSYECESGLQMKGHTTPRNCSIDGTWSSSVPYCDGGICNTHSEFFSSQYCYDVKTDTKTWTEASESCSSSNGTSNLAYISDVNSQKNISSQLGNDNYWIGLYEVLQWYWRESYVPMTYTNWESGSDVDKKSKCFLKRFTGEWSSKESGATMGYICQFDDKCPEHFSANGDFFEYDTVKIDGNTYCFVFNPSASIDWYGAIERCTYYYHDQKNGGKTMSGRLAEITDNITQTYITDLITFNSELSAGDDYWIGAQRVNKNPRLWKWTNGFNLTYSSWDSSEPSNVGERKGNCVILQAHGYDWNADGCDSKSRYICSNEPRYKTEDFCGFPGGIPNGVVSSNQSRYDIGDIAVYTCETGYFIAGTSSLECVGPEGKWLGNQPICIAVNCSSTPPDVPSALYTVVSFSYRGIAIYECNNTFQMIGYGVVACLSNATWSQPTFFCQPPLTTIVHGQTSNSGFTSVSSGTEADNTHSTNVVDTTNPFLPTSSVSVSDVNTHSTKSEENTIFTTTTPDYLTHNDLTALFVMFGGILILNLFLLLLLIGMINKSGHRVFPVNTDSNPIEVVSASVEGEHTSKVTTFEESTLTIETNGIWLREYDRKVIKDPWKPIYEENFF